MKDGLIISMLSIVPKNATARFMGWSARLQLPRFLHRMLIRWFVWKYGVNLNECEQDIDDFNSLADFFLRRLKPDVRNISSSPDTWISPVDGAIHAFGKIEEGKFFQSTTQKGDISNLLGADQDFISDLPLLDPQRFQNGGFAILYLSPKDYHRVHVPFDCNIKHIRYIPGKLWPVFPAATRKIASLFDRNERLVFELNTSTGAAALVMVGAFGVGRMSSSFLDIKCNTKKPGKEIALDTTLVAGAELGAFELGSTVILVWDKEPVEWKIQQGNNIQLGEAIARFQ